MALLLVVVALLWHGGKYIGIGLHSWDEHHRRADLTWVMFVDNPPSMEAFEGLKNRPQKSLLNVAGPRTSKEPEAGAFVRDVPEPAFYAKASTP